jgi:hypothetical protein
MLRKDLINLDFLPKLLSLKVAGFWDLYYDARVHLVDKGDASLPDPVHIGELLSDIHHRLEEDVQKRVLLGVSIMREKKRGPWIGCIWTILYFGSS